MKKETAVEFLQRLYDNSSESFLLDEEFQQAKELEKQQSKEDYEAGVWSVGCRNTDFEKYYEETYRP